MLLTRYICLFMLFACAATHAEIRWRNCGFASVADPASRKVRLQCARLAVPMAYDHHGVARHDQCKIRLQLHRIPARGERLGTLLLISGGPGEASALRLLPADHLPAKIREHFDVVGYDPRGIGASSPLIHCGNEPPQDAKAFVEGCVAHTNPAFLPHIGTFEAAHDVEYIRRALGEDKLNIIGYSYGSKVAMRYALHHPQGVRALVLDGMINVHHSMYRHQERQQRGFQQAAERFLAACQQQTDCPFADARADQHMLRPLMLARARLEKADAEKKAGNPFLGLLDKGGLRARPIPTDDELRNVFYLGLLQEEHWPYLADMMADFMAERPERFREQFGALMDNPGHMTTLAAIICADVAARGSDTVMLRHLDLLSPWDNHHLPYRPVQAGPCVHWPYTGSDYRHPLPPLPETLPQMLLVSHEHDPTTSWQNAREMADWLHAPLLSVEGNGHIATMTARNACADKAVTDYLLHPEKTLQDRRCTAGNSEQTLARAILLLGVAWLLWRLWRRRKKAASA